MKIAHFCSSVGGGAGIASLRLHEGLIESGLDSRFYNKSVSKLDKRIFPITDFPLGKRDKLFRKIKNKYGKNLEIFSSPYDGFCLNPSAFQEDILHFHWVAGLINYSSLPRLSGKPIVWTLHDMNPFLGGVHYRGDEERLHFVLKLYEWSFRKFKKKCFGMLQRDQVHFVCLTPWMEEQMKKNTFFRRFPVHIIPNGVPKESFLTKRSEARKKLKMKDEKFYLLMLAQDLRNPRKGGAFYKKILPLLLKEGVEVIVVGEGDLGADYPEVKKFGRLDCPESLAMVYTSVDLFLLASLEDNYPNVMLEATLCGTPVLCGSNGGMKYYINERNGILFQELKVETVLKAVRDIKANYFFNRNEIAMDAARNTSISKMAENYISLYDEVLK